MTQNIKPLIEQLKESFPATEQVRSAILKTRTSVEAKARETARDLLNQTRESRIVNQYVVPLLQSEKTEHALQALGQKFAKVPLAPKMDLGAKLEKYRKELLNLATSRGSTVNADLPSEADAIQTDESAAQSAQPEATEKTPIKVKRSKSAGSDSKS